MITESAPAKLNLALHVRARRPDGYHELETLFAFATDGDTVSVERADTPTFEITGPFAAALDPNDDNLVLRAVRTFAAKFGGNDNYRIVLDKHLPVASGIGGGSADAAATLRALARLNGVAVNSPDLFACARDLCSDVPACLLGRTAIGRGRGEQLEPVDGPTGAPVLLINPGIAVSTARVFADWGGIDRGPLPTLPADGRNDLEAPARALAPTIGAALDLLTAQRRTSLVRMSGSGATCFALFDDLAARDTAAQSIASAQPDWWQLATMLA